MRLTTARCAAYAAALLVLARSTGPAGAQGERALLDAVVDAPAGRAVSQCFAVEPGEVAATVRVVDAYERGVQPIMFGMGMAGDPELARVLSMVPTVEVTFRFLSSGLGTPYVVLRMTSTWPSLGGSSDARRRLQASLQRRQASAQTRQCCMCPACCSHSSPHRRQARAQTSSISRASSGDSCRERIRPVVAQTSAQCRLSRMQRTRFLTSCSARQASAQAVQVWAQSKQASIHWTKTASAASSTGGLPGLVSSICRA